MTGGRGDLSAADIFRFEIVEQPRLLFDRVGAGSHKRIDLAVAAATR